MTVYGRPCEMHFYCYNVDLKIASCDYVCVMSCDVLLYFCAINLKEEIIYSTKLNWS